MIETKLLNGIKIVYNTTRNLTIATLSDGKTQQLKDFLVDNPNATVVISPANYGDFDLTFDVEDFEVLEDLTEIKNVILTIDRKMKSYSGLYYLSGLLSLEAWLADSIDIDFSFFKHLENVSFNWTPATKHFFNCDTLNSIRVWKYKAKDKTLFEFSALKNIESLDVIQSNITTISGIEHLQYLKTLMLGYNTALEINYTQLGFTLPNIEELEINTCRKVTLDFIKIFPNVKKLTLVQFQDIEQLKPVLDGLPKLEKLSVEATRILETDNTYYLNYPNIKEFFFVEKKYHKLKNKDLKR